MGGNQAEALSGFLILGRCWRFMRIAHGLATAVHTNDAEEMAMLAQVAVSWWFEAFMIV